MFNIGKGEEEIKQLSYNYDIEQEAKLMKELNSLNVSSVSEKMLKDDSKSFTNEFKLLILRSYIHNYRYPFLMILRLVSQIIITAITSGIFYGLIFNIMMLELKLEASSLSHYSR